MMLIRGSFYQEVEVFGQSNPVDIEAKQVWDIRCGLMP